MSKITIVLADDHPVVRQGLRALLEAEGSFQVIGETGDGLLVADLVNQLKPTVLILDLVMPGLGGLDVLRQVTQHSPGTKVIVLSMYSNEAYVLEALKNGSRGYVLKDSDSGDLLLAVHEVIAGRIFLSSPFTQRAIEAYTQKTESSTIDPYETLTEREREVLHLAAEGHRSIEIARMLSISPRTAEGHRTSLMRKLHLHNQSDLVRYALNRGLLPPEDIRGGQNRNKYRKD